MTDEQKGRTEEEEGTPLADEELEEVAGGKILNRGNRRSGSDDDIDEKMIKD